MILTQLHPILWFQTLMQQFCRWLPICIVDMERNNFRAKRQSMPVHLFEISQYTVFVTSDLYVNLENNISIRHHLAQYSQTSPLKCKSNSSLKLAVNYRIIKNFALFDNITQNNKIRASIWGFHYISKSNHHRYWNIFNVLN